MTAGTTRRENSSTSTTRSPTTTAGRSSRTCELRMLRSTRPSRSREAGRSSATTTGLPRTPRASIPFGRTIATSRPPHLATKTSSLRRSRRRLWTTPSDEDHEEDAYSHRSKGKCPRSPAAAEAPPEGEHHQEDGRDRHRKLVELWKGQRRT